jgi:hypothetical protein
MNKGSPRLPSFLSGSPECDCCDDEKAFSMVIGQVRCDDVGEKGKNGLIAIWMGIIMDDNAVETTELLVKDWERNNGTGIANDGRTIGRANVERLRGILMITPYLPKLPGWIIHSQGEPEGFESMHSMSEITLVSIFFSGSPMFSFSSSDSCGDISHSISETTI